MLIDRELVGVFGDVTGDEPPVFAQRATEQLSIREAKIAAREREVDTDEKRMREWSKRLRRREEELEAREQRSESVSKVASPHSTARVKIGRNERCPCGSGLKYKHCHGLAGRRTYCRIWAGYSPTRRMGRTPSCGTYSWPWKTFADLAHCSVFLDLLQVAV